MLNSKETKIWCEMHKKWESYYAIIFIDWDNFENYSSIVLQTSIILLICLEFKFDFLVGYGLKFKLGK